MDVGHDVVAHRRQLRRPVISQVGGRHRQRQLPAGQIGAHLREQRAQLRGRHLLTEEDLVGDDEALEIAVPILVKNVPHLAELPGVGGGVAVLPDTHPDLDRVFHLELVDGVDEHLRLIAVCSVKSNGISQLRQHGQVAGDVVLRGGIVDAIRVLRVDRRVVDSREDLVQVRVVHELLDLGAVDVEIAIVSRVIRC